MFYYPFPVIFRVLLFFLFCNYTPKGVISLYALVLLKHRMFQKLSAEI